ncbi:MAG TPA: sigma-54 dependent transcriptional regulator [Polyangia bacterium]|jgi:two-component system response regulator PilR (NtrC family)
MRKRILVVDGDTTAQSVLLNLLGNLEYDAVPAFDGADAIARLRRESFDLCMTDVRLPGPDIPHVDGYAVLKEAERHHPAIPVVMLRAEATVSDAVSAVRAGAVNFLRKPFHPSTVEDILRRVLEGAPGAPAQPRAPGVAAGAAIVGEHPVMRALLDQVARIADTDAGVLLRGETGTGKEVIARLIHASGRQSGGPFVAVNMAAIPENLVESELFGHVRGAFTGADGNRVGRIAAAHQGTIFFDEIGDMPRGLQAKLLRVIQDREVTPVGGIPLPVDLRIIAATHCNLEAMVAEGSFREDLFYRLDVVPIEVPPLRLRRSDIPALAEHFRREINLREGRSVPAFSSDVMERLCAHDWPGNVRELENLVERLVIVAGNRNVTTRDLPAPLRFEPVDIEAAPLDLPAAGVDLRTLLSQLEDRLISQALARTGGNKNRAAELLGMNRTTLVEKLRRRNVA